jgi:hypothetical protein
MNSQQVGVVNNHKQQGKVAIAQIVKTPKKSGGRRLATKW